MSGPSHSATQVTTRNRAGTESGCPGQEWSKGPKNVYGHSLVPAMALGTKKPHLVKYLSAPCKSHALRAGEESMRLE